MSDSKQQKAKRVSNDQKSRPNLYTPPWDELKVLDWLSGRRSPICRPFGQTPKICWWTRGRHREELLLHSFQGEWVCKFPWPSLRSKNCVMNDTHSWSRSFLEWRLFPLFYSLRGGVHRWVARSRERAKPDAYHLRRQCFGVEQWKQCLLSKQRFWIQNISI